MADLKGINQIYKGEKEKFAFLKFISCYDSHL